MEEDIQNYSPTVMFRGTPCSINQRRYVAMKRMIEVPTHDIDKGEYDGEDD